jgi:hypothetical protein
MPGWVVTFEKAAGNSSLRVLLSSQDGRLTGGIADPNQYNAETHEVDISDLSLERDALGGRIRITLHPAVMHEIPRLRPETLTRPRTPLGMTKNALAQPLSAHEDLPAGRQAPSTVKAGLFT